MTPVGSANNPSAVSFGYFGNAIDSTNGTRLIAGAYGNDVGASARAGGAYLFTVDPEGGAVDQTCALTSATPPSDHENFGGSVGIAGRWMVIGISGFDGEFGNQGAVDLYQVISTCGERGVLLCLEWNFFFPV